MFRGRRWSWLAVTGLVLVASTAVGGAASAATTAPTAKSAKVKAGDTYVALGSSFVSGPTIPPVADTPCLRSSQNYPSLVATKLKLTLTDVSCGNATTAEILTTPQRGNPPQIQAVGPDTRLVTITIGGNDVDYTVSNLICAHDGAANTSCLGNGVDQQSNATKMAALPGKMAATLQAIKQAAPKARVIVLPYLRVMPASATPCPPEVPMDAATLKYLVDYGDQLHAVIKKAAADAKVDFVDSYVPKGHDACATAAQRWVEGEVPSPTAFPFHPNALGMKVQADMILKRLKQ